MGNAVATGMMPDPWDRGTSHDKPCKKETWGELLFTILISVLMFFGFLVHPVVYILIVATAFWWDIS